MPAGKARRPAKNPVGTVVGRGIALPQLKEIHLPRLDGLRPTLESTALKLMEEAGELGAAIGKFRGLSGERVSTTEAEAIQHVARELLDVAQTAVTMMFVLEESHGINLDELLAEHIEKLVRKGYLT
jgi:NTP pyrophosphatase (non-canonical NTP hydrolase)